MKQTFEKVNKIDRHPTRLTKTKIKVSIKNKTWYHDSSDINRAIKGYNCTHMTT